MTRAAVLADFEAIELPAGYELEWDGEYKSSQESNLGLVPGFPPAFVVMTLVIVALFIVAVHHHYYQRAVRIVLPYMQ